MNWREWISIMDREYRSRTNTMGMCTW